jgi:protein TonB
MASPKNLIWATGGSVAINGALLALLVLTLPKAAAPLRDDTLWVSLETAAEAQTEGAPEPTPSPPVPPATSQPQPASTPQVPVQSATVLPPQSLVVASAQTGQSESKPATSPAAKPAAPSHPAPAQTNTQPQTTAPSGGSKHAASYAAKVRAHIESFKVYPPQARRRHQTGVVAFTFTIDRQGRVLSAQVTKSSGSPALDQAALNMLNSAQPLPKPPSDLSGETLRMTSSAEFGLTD